MAANLAGSRAHGTHRFTVVSLDLRRLHTMRSKHGASRLPMAFILAVTGAIVVATLVFLGAPLWLAAAFGVVIAALVPAFADTGGLRGAGDPR